MNAQTKWAVTRLSTINHLAVLDLLGAKTLLIHSYFLSMAWLFDGLVAAEHWLGQLGFFKEAKPQAQPPAEGGDWNSWQSFFVPHTGWDVHSGWIKDNHMPFLHKGVNILHVISSPFESGIPSR